MKKLLLLVGLMSSVAFGQNAPSGSPRVQGTPAGYGDPVQVTIRSADGSAPGALGSVTVSSSALPTGAATSAAQTTAATSNGAPGDTACATDTASCSANAQRQRIAQRLTTINTTLGTPFQAGASIGNTSFAATQSGTWNIGTVTTLPALPANQSTNVAQLNAVTPLMGNGVTGTGSLRVTVASDNTAFSVNAAQSGTWNVTNVSGTVSLPTGASTAAKQPALGTAGTPSADIISIQAPTSNIWSYAAAASGISNTTTAVTVKTAGGASVRTFVTSMDLSFSALGVATEFAIRDGAAGTVLWRMTIPAGVAGMREITFATPLRGTANTLLEVVTLTASVTGAVYINLQGYTGS